MQRQHAATRKFRMYTCDGYSDHAWVKEFEEKFNATVTIFYGSDVDQMFAKMAGFKGADFDLFVVDTNTVPRYQKNGLMAPIDVTKIPNTVVGSQFGGCSPA